MGKHSRCVIGVCCNDMQYPELHKKHSNVDEQKSNPLIVQQILFYRCILVQVQYIIKSIQIQLGTPSIFQGQVQYIIRYAIISQNTAKYCKGLKNISTADNANEL